MHPARSANVPANRPDRRGRGKKLIEVWDWVVTRREYCQACRAAQAQAGEEDCKTCEGRCPDLLPENEETWQLWLAVCTQLRATAFCVLGLDYTAVYQTADVLGIEMVPSMLQRIQALEAYEIERLNKRAEGGGQGGQ